MPGFLQPPVDRCRAAAIGSDMTASRARRPSPALVVALLALVIAVAASPAGGAVAGALDVKTVKKIAKKTADKEIKKKAKTLTVAHARNADSLGGVPANGYARAGTVTMGQSAVGWVNLSPATLSYTRFISYTEIEAPSAGTRTFTYPLDVPVRLAGGPVTLTTLRYCYKASAGAHLAQEIVWQMTFEAGGGSSVGPQITTSLDLADADCRTIAVNRPLGPHDQVNLLVVADWTVPNALFRLGGVTATYAPS
jgi:hypothetical protein